MTGAVSAKTSEPTRPQTEFYVQAQAGGYKAQNENATIGLALGGEFSKNGTFGQAEVGLGTSVSANMKVGHEFEIGKNMGLELSANGQYVQSMSESEVHIKTLANNNSEGAVGKYDLKWKDGFYRAGAGCMLNYKGKKGKIGIGAEAGYQGFTSPDMKYTLDEYKVQNNNVVTNSKVEYTSGTKIGSAYVTPKISGELNLDKKGYWSAILDADLKQGKAGIRYTF